MRLAVVGATGGTGTALTVAALDAGHQVTTVVRDPGRLIVSSDRVRIVRADVLQPGSLDDALDGVDAVCSTLGTRDRGPTTVYSAGITAIITAMHTAGVRRLIAISAATLSPREQVTLVERWIVLPLLDRIFAEGYADMRRMEQRIRGCDLDWTILRPPRLLDGPATGHYRTAVDRPLPGARSIRRGDLALGILAVLDDPVSAGTAITIAH